MAIPVWTAREFAQYYSVTDGRQGSPTKGEEFGYGRTWALLFNTKTPGALTHFLDRWQRCVDVMGISPEDRVLIVGAAFGFLVESARDSGYPNVFGLDSSDYVAHDPNNDRREDIDILHYDLRDPLLKEHLETALGVSSFDLVITEDMVACYSDEDVQSFAPILNSLADQVLHITTVGSHNPKVSDINWHTLEEWKALIPTHIWMTSSGEKI